ncbi:MAG: hypothetical protein ACYDH9_09125 [Limisphaerales bacterium]
MSSFCANWHLVDAGYGLIWWDARPEEAAFFIRRFLRHPRFETNASRLGIVTRTHHDGVEFWQLMLPYRSA